MIINEAAMQALGSYEGGRMLSLGLGTGLGTALVRECIPMKSLLCASPFRPRQHTLVEFSPVSAES